MNLLSARSARNSRGDSRDATATVSALYIEHALGLTWLAQVVLRDRSTEGAEDVVHDAFPGLCRRWSHRSDTDKAKAYLRPATHNGPTSDMDTHAASSTGFEAWWARTGAPTITGIGSRFERG
jgi:hypothetical protein